MTKSSNLFTTLKRYFVSGEHTLTRLHTKRRPRSSPSQDARGNAAGAADVDTEDGLVNDQDIYEEAATMVKSNKFDYSKKKNTGVSLGQFIAKQLDGEAEAVKRAAGRAARKSVGSTDGPEMNTSVIHYIDLKIPSKELGDEGLNVLCAGLEAAFDKGDADASLALEDLNLTDNALTTAGLARLGSVIAKSALDIKTIVLTNNAITVETNEQAEQWEIFLRSFAKCQKLRRLDLSGNPGLAGRAMEIFAMLHIREPQIDPIRPFGAASVLSLDSTANDDTRSQSGSLKWEINGNASRPRHSMSDGRTLTRRCGLRSIPFISLKECELTDVGALWLSFVIEDHYFPIQLVSELNAAVADSSIEAYQQNSKVHGVDWLSNESTLSKDGLALLVKTEWVRKQTVLDDRSTLAGSVIEASTDSTVRGNCFQTGRRPSRAEPGNRRVSLKSTVSAQDDPQGLTELDSLRKRIQRQVIAHTGPKSTELWRTSLQLLRLARCLMMAAPTTRTIYTDSDLTDGMAVDSPTMHIVSPATSSKASTKAQPPRISIDAASGQSAARSSYAGTLVSSENALTDVTNTPTTPKRVFKPHRKDAFSHGPDAMTVAEKLTGLGIKSACRAEYARYQEQRISDQGEHTFRDKTSFCHLPKSLLDQILSQAMQGRRVTLMTEAQKEAVVGWGMRRENLTTGLHGKDVSFRAWRLLDNIKCVEYASQ